MNVADDDALALPGDQISPDLLRINDRALDLIPQFVESGRIVTAICPAPRLLIDCAGLRDRRLSGAPIRQNPAGDRRRLPTKGNSVNSVDFPAHRPAHHPHQ